MTPNTASALQAQRISQSSTARRLRRVAILGLAGAVTTVVGTGLVSPANADAGIYTTGDVNLRTGPGTQFDPVGVVPRGNSPHYLCWSRGESIDGVDVWFRVQWDGQVGYISSALDDSSYESAEQIETNYGVAPCGTETLSDGTADYFDRGAAAAWAYEHATGPQDFQAGCTWFVSNALWAGGLPKTEQWTDAGGHGRWPWSRRPGTPEATAVNPFRDWFLAQYPASTVEPLDFSANAVPDAEPGDLITYDWEGDGVWDHFAIVTSISDGDYPNVAEWGTNDDWWVAHPTVSYSERGWTWSENSDRWLQESYPAVQAELIHVDPSHPLTY